MKPVELAFVHQTLNSIIPDFRHKQWITKWEQALQIRSSASGNRPAVCSLRSLQRSSCMMHTKWVCGKSVPQLDANGVINSNHLYTAKQQELKVIKSPFPSRDWDGYHNWRDFLICAIWRCSQMAGRNKAT